MMKNKTILFVAVFSHCISAYSLAESHPKYKNSQITINGQKIDLDCLNDVRTKKCQNVKKIGNVLVIDEADSSGNVSIQGNLSNTSINIRNNSSSAIRINTKNKSTSSGSVSLDFD